MPLRHGVPRVLRSCHASGCRGESLALGRIGDQGGQGARQRRLVPRRKGDRRAVAVGQLRKPADPRHHERPAEGEGGVEHARLVDLAVGKHDQIGAPEERRELGVVDEARKEADRARGGVGQCLELRHVDTRDAGDPQLGALDLRERAQQQIHSLVVAEEAEEENHGLLHRRELRRQRALFGQPREMVERPMRDHMDALRRDAELRAQALGSMLGMHHHGIHPEREPPEGGGLAAARLARHHIVSGEDPRALARQQPRGGLLEAQPLVVHDIRSAGVAPEPRHVER